MGLLWWSSGASGYLDGPPRGVHQWRQTDCASQALNYHQNGVSFWTPQEHNRTGYGGFSASEFPLVYWSVAQLYGWFGAEERVFRLFQLGLSLLGLAFLYAIGLYWGLPRPAALVPVWLLGSAPAYFYYGMHFLPNVPAIGLSFMGWYGLFRLWGVRGVEGAADSAATPRIWPWMLLSGLGFGLATLLKVSDGMGFVAAVLVVALAHSPLASLLRLRAARLPRRARWPALAIGMILVAAAVGWSLYTVAFNRAHDTQLSLLGILPIWIVDADQIAAIGRRFRGEWNAHLFHPWSWWAMGIGLVLFLAGYRRLDPRLRTIALLLILGSIGYLLLWFDPLYHHDYYMLSPFVAPVFVLLAVLEWLFRKPDKGLPEAGPGSVLGHSHHRQGRFLALLLLVPAALWGIATARHNAWFQEHRNRAAIYENVPGAFYRLEQHLRALGIDRHQRIISAGDITRNVSLYLINNPGWTDVYNERIIDLEEMRRDGAQYWIVSDTAVLSLDKYGAGPGPLIDTFEGLRIHRVRDALPQDQWPP